MCFELTGKLVAINETQQVSERFKKREFVLEIAEEINGNVYTNYAKMQLVQNKCEIIDNFQIGDTVKVSFNIKGNKWERDGNVNYITNLDAWRVENAQQGAQGHVVELEVDVELRRRHLLQRLAVQGDDHVPLGQVPHQPEQGHRRRQRRESDQHVEERAEQRTERHLGIEELRQLRVGVLETPACHQTIIAGAFCGSPGGGDRAG